MLFWQIMYQAEKRQDLKDLVWKIYQDPKMVIKAIEALKSILGEKN